MRGICLGLSFEAGRLDRAADMRAREHTAGRSMRWAGSGAQGERSERARRKAEQGGISGGVMRAVSASEKQPHNMTYAQTTGFLVLPVADLAERGSASKLRDRGCRGREACGFGISEGSMRIGVSFPSILLRAGRA